MSFLKTLVILILLCPLHAVVNGQLSAEFSATQYSGCAPVIINFTDASKGAPQNWKWVVTDASSTLIASAGTKSFVTNFSKEGSYDVKLLVTNGSKQDSVIKKIIVYAKPSVSFTEDIITGCFPLKTNFKETGSIGQGGITKWEWDFGDGKSASTNNSFNTYTTAGSFNVSLRLTSDKGCSDVLTKSNLIQINKGALARFSAIPLGLTCKYPEEVSFKNTSTGTGTLKYVWDFGTGDTAHSINANHTYTYQGLYNVTLRVSNDAGCADTLIIKDAVTVGSANAAFTSPASVCAGSILSLQNVSTQGTTSSHWTFGDNTFSDSINPVKKFTNPGIFGIQLINTFANCVDTASYTVIVQPGPVVSFSSLQTSDCQIPSQFTFTNTSQNATNYSWDFGNGSTSTQQNPTAIFNTPGKYNIKLVATTSRGCTDSLTRSEYIQVYQLTTDNITGVPYSGCAPYRTVFRPQFNNLFPGDVVTAYKWDLGNGSTSTAAQPPVTYNDPGEYTVKLSIETARGCKADFVFDTTIHLPHTPIAQFSASPDTACGAGPVYFVNETQSVDSVIKWTWIFGDGGTSHAKDPVSYGYDFTGSFRPVLIADIRGCKDTSASQTIFVKGPIAHHAVIFPDCNFPFRRTFNNFSVGTIVSYDWDFGDGSPHSFVANPPPHDYPNITATYQTSLTITGVNGCPPQKNIRDTRIIARTAGFNYSSEVCNLDSASFSVTGILPTDVKNFTWLFGDGKSITTDGAQVEIKHKYKDSKKYTATLIVLDIFNCTQIITHVISVNGPSAKFNNPANACVNSNVSFSDLSTITNGNPIMQYQWQFGDNTPDSIVTAKKIIHSYSAGGDYTIKLVITDTKGCTDTTMGKLSISDPKANFNLKDSIFCPNSDILFANTSTGTSLTSSWNFGDGKTSAQKDPVHNYKLINSYIISLKVTDGIGCTNTITSNLRIDTPKAHFTIDTSVAICPPLKVLFTNQSTSYASAEWTFGDGDALSILKDSVSHIYNTPGTFYPTLKVYGNGGCSSSYKNDSISIKGPFGIFTYDPLTACAGVNSISFHVTNQNDVAIYNWDFGGRNGLAQTADPDIKHVFDSAMSFVPFVILQNRQGCQFRLDGKEPIKIQNVSARISKLQQNVFCGTGSVEFHDASFSVNDTPVSWQWNFGDGNTSSLTNPIHDFKNPGIYPVTLMVSTENGCRDITSLEIPVKVVIQPVIAITGDSTGCTPATLNFKGELLTTDTSAITWEWDFKNGQVSADQVPVAQVYSSGNNYIVTAAAVNSSGCVANATRSIIIHASPVIDAGADRVVCYGDTVKITATGAQTYLWNTSPGLNCSTCATAFINPVINTTYYVTGKDQYGCTGNDSTTATVQQQYTLSVSPLRDTLCVGETLRLQASGADVYQWSPSTYLNSTNIASPVSTPASTITYTVTSNDINNCFPRKQEVVVIVYPIPVIHINNNDVLVEVGSKKQLIAIVSPDVTNYLWSPAKTLSCETCASPFASPSFKTTYTLQASNPGHCMMTDTVTLFTTCNKNSNLFIPNTFSPNNDGVNDRFIVQGHGINTIRSVTLFNRWGQVIFQRRNIPINSADDSWDGTYNGNRPVADVYTYIVEIVCDNNQILHYQGNVTLIQ